MKRSKFKADQITISKIYYKSGSLDNANYEGKDPENYLITVDFSSAYNIETKKVRSEIKFEISGKFEDDIISKAIYNIVFFFHVENLEELCIKEGDQQKIDGNLGNALTSISYSTSRGLLTARLQGTPLQNFILPVINPNDLLNKKIKTKTDEIKDNL